jgi:hypothetical protein
MVDLAEMLGVKTCMFVLESSNRITGQRLGVVLRDHPCSARPALSVLKTIAFHRARLIELYTCTVSSKHSIESKSLFLNSLK